MGGAVERPFVIEPFDPERHDRKGFNCGVAAVDNYFQHTANKLAKSGNVRLYVMAAPDAVAGFYTLNAHAVDYEALPARYARSRPAHGSIPAAFISMVGRDERHRGSGIGGDLLFDALARIARAADQIGIAVVLLDVLDCGNPERVARRQALYEGYAFTPLPSNPRRLFLPVGTVQRLLREGAESPSEDPADFYADRGGDKEERDKEERDKKGRHRFYETSRSHRGLLQHGGGRSGAGGPRPIDRCIV